MIPIVSISNLVSALLFVGVSFRLYFSYRQTKDKKMGNFFKSFLCLTSALLLLASPGLIVTDLKIIGLIFAIYPFLILLGFAYLGLIPLTILEWEKVREIFFWGMIAAAFLITILNLINWGPAIVYLQDPFIYWEDTRGTLLNIILGAIIGLGLLLVIFFFFVHGLKASEKYVKIRAFLIIGALIGLLLMAIINFVFGASPQSYITSAIAAFLGIISGLLLLSGILYKYEPSSQ